MRWRIMTLLLLAILFVSACSKTQQQQQGQSPEQTKQSQQAELASSSKPDQSGEPAATTPTPQPPATTSAQAEPPSPKSQWHEEQQKAAQEAGVKPPETSWNNTAAAPQPQPVVIPAGSHITIRLSQSIDAKKNKAGDSFEGTVAQPIVIDEKSVVPVGSVVTGKVTDAAPAGKLKGEGRLAIKLTHISVGGGSYAISTNTVANKLHGKGKRSAMMIGGGGGAGALVGGLVGGGKGAAIGAIVGGGAGTAGATLTGNQQLAFTAESALTFTLKQPLKLSSTPSHSKEGALAKSP